MMRNNPREKVPQAKQDGGVDGGRAAAAGTTMASSRTTWAGLKDARIVRVVRSLGGKDRHSKVNTVRGLRDRRVRLSVPTAIQLYDLQDRLGVSQPSKAVDWLLDAARHEIDKLPPLKIPPGSFLQSPESAAAAAAAAASDPGVSLFLPEREEEEGEEDPSPSPMAAAAAAVDWRAKRRGSPSVWEAQEGKNNGLFRRIEQQPPPPPPPHSAAVPVRSDGHGCSSMLSEHHPGYHLPASSAQLCAPHLGCYQLSQQGGEALQGYTAAPIDQPLSMFSPYAAAAAAAAAAAGYDHRQANGFHLGSSAAQGFLLGYLPGAGALHGSSAAGGGANMRPLQVTIASRLSDGQHHRDNGADCEL